MHETLREKLSRVERLRSTAATLEDEARAAQNEARLYRAAVMLRDAATLRKLAECAVRRRVRTQRMRVAVRR